MQRTPSPASHSADLIGLVAHQTLSPESSGSVLDGYSRATYLCSDEGEVLWLTHGDVPMHRRGIRVHPAAPRPQSGSRYRVRHGVLLMGSEIVVDLNHARVWGPPPLVDFGQEAEAQMNGSGDLPLPAPTGFGVLLPWLGEPGLPFRTLASELDPIVAAAYPAICAVAGACREEDLDALVRHAAGLIGLGAGLTPSGDDYVGGVLFGLAMLREAGTPMTWCTPGTVAEFVQDAKTRTNRISAALLGDHAAGHASETLHRLASAYLIDRSGEAVQRAVDDLVRMGHSTGWDLLTGVWTAMTLVPSGVAPANPGPVPGPSQRL